MDWKKTIKDSWANARGWRTSQKIVVFESDDWGSIRMPNVEAKNALRDFGVKVDNCPYLSNDSLESAADISALLEILHKYKDSKGNSARFTFNTIMANPDFDKIRMNDFSEYTWEHFHTTYNRYGFSLQQMKEIWVKGIQEDLIRPQFHGREHVQINRWLKGLKNRSSESVKAFDLEILGVSTTVTTENRLSYLPAFDLDCYEEIPVQREILKEGFVLFEKTFGFPSASFIAPNYTWNTALETTMMQYGVRYIQGARAQRVPLGSGETRISRHSLGQRGNLGQVYSIRNVQFEPSFNPRVDWADSAINQINLAFFWKKPAIISTHRLNYIGSLNQFNRTRGLTQLNRLLARLLKQHPDVVFMFSDELGDCIANCNK